ncbi:MAG: hypothetical protein KAI76_02815, partial [Alphaproteobacteria bacterium]|nr:hypothetical protein [Alphaproteobacteria bacterium]
SASTYAQSHNENSTNEPYAGTKEDNQIKTSPNTQETSHMNLRKRPNDVEDEPTLNTGLYDED